MIKKISMYKLENIRYDDFYKLKNPINKIEFLLQYAILAPSTHNTQPWLFKIKENSCEVYLDKKNMLPEADPLGENMIISVGACIENLVIMSNYLNVYDAIAYHTDCPNNLISEIFFKNLDRKYSTNQIYEEFSEAIPKRFTYRGIFSNKSIDLDSVNNLLSTYNNSKIKVNVLERTEEINYIGNLTHEAIKEIAGRSKFRKELSRWIRNNYSTKKDGIPAHTYGFSDIVSIIAPFAMSKLNLSEIMAKKTRNSINSANAVFIFSVPDSESLTILNLGRIIERYLLAITALKMKTNIAIAAIQDHSSNKRLQSYLNIKEKPKFLFVSGYHDSDIYSTPRYNTKEKLIV